MVRVVCLADPLLETYVLLHLFAWFQKFRRSTTPPLVREVRLSESIDFLTGFSRLLIWSRRS